MFEKLLSTMGFGTAKVDTIITHEKIELGSVVKGEVHVIGGKVKKDIGGITIDFIHNYYREEEFSEVHYISKIIHEINITDKFTISPKEKKIIPFTFMLPYNFPLTFGESSITVLTKLDIEMSPNSEDLEPIYTYDKKVDELFALLHSNNWKHPLQSGCEDRVQQYFEIKKQNKVIDFTLEISDKELKVKNKKTKEFILLKKDTPIDEKKVFTFFEK